MFFRHVKFYAVVAKEKNINTLRLSFNLTTQSLAHNTKLCKETARRRKSPLSITQLVKRMGISRGTYYNHKDDPNLPFEDIEKYGKILGYDFTSDFPEMHKYAFEEPIAPYGNPKNFDEAVKQKDYWKDKYLNLLEKYNKVIEERMGG